MGNTGHVQPYGQLPWPHSQHLLIQVDVQGPVRVIGIFVVLVTGQGVLRDNRNAVSGSTHLPHNPTGPHLPSQKQTSRSTPMRASDLGPGAQHGRGIRTVNGTEVQEVLTAHRAELTRAPGAGQGEQLTSGISSVMMSTRWAGAMSSSLSVCNEL